MERRVESFLIPVGEEAGAAERLIAAFPRQAAHQRQQAAEKMARAVLAHAAIPFGTSHNLGQMAAALPEEHERRAPPMRLDRMSPAATRYRYPAPGGRLAPPPDEDTLHADLVRFAA